MVECVSIRTCVETKTLSAESNSRTDNVACYNAAKSLRSAVGNVAGKVNSACYNAAKGLRSLHIGLQLLPPTLVSANRIKEPRAHTPMFAKIYSLALRAAISDHASVTYLQVLL